MSLNQIKYKWMNEYNKMPLNHVRKPLKIHAETNLLCWSYMNKWCLF